MMIVKLGGSVITRKDRYRSFRRAVTRRLAREIADSGEQVVLVHGAGSFGHLVASRHNLDTPGSCLLSDCKIKDYTQFPLAVNKRSSLVCM